MLGAVLAVLPVGRVQSWGTGTQGVLGAAAGMELAAVPLEERAGSYK